MKKTLLFVGVLCSFGTFSQTTLFSDDFESGSANWTLNTGSGANQWLLNNVYAGFSGFIADTPDQPSGINGYPESNYLHICNTTACSSLSICNANWDTGSTSNQDATMVTAVSTTGMTSTTISFWYLAVGYTGTALGTLKYSTDGSTWIDAGTYVNVATWTQATVSLPAFDNQASLKFRFNWINSGTNGTDPAFSVDDILITAVNSPITAVSTGTATEWCYNDNSSFPVNFTSSGTYNIGNVFTAELSDASGSFAAPTSIGTLSSTTAGSLSITSLIPLSTATGTGYRIRVSSSNPAETSVDNGTDLVINALPTVNAGVDQNACVGQNVTLTATGAASYSWDNGITNGVPFSQPQGAVTYTVIGTAANGCENTDQVVVTVSVCAGITEYTNDGKIEIYPNPVVSGFMINNTTNSAVTSIKVVDLNGKTMKSFDYQESGNYAIDGLAAGTYFVIVSGENQTFSKRIIKN